MSNREPDWMMTRRSALGQIATTMMGTVGISRTALGESNSSAGGAIRLERQPTGSEIWQVTTERFQQSNIYCEIPYCSGNSKYFVHERKNPNLKGRNRIELMAVEIGTCALVKGQWGNVASSLSF